jgi:hypothetical protein
MDMKYGYIVCEFACSPSRPRELNQPRGSLKPSDASARREDLAGHPVYNLTIYVMHVCMYIYMITLFNALYDMNLYELYK